MAAAHRTFFLKLAFGLVNRQVHDLIKGEEMWYTLGPVGSIEDIDQTTFCFSRHRFENFAVQSAD